MIFLMVPAFILIGEDGRVPSIPWWLDCCLLKLNKSGFRITPHAHLRNELSPWNKGTDEVPGFEKSEESDRGSSPGYFVSLGRVQNIKISWDSIAFLKSNWAWKNWFFTWIMKTGWKEPMVYWCFKCQIRMVHIWLHWLLISCGKNGQGQTIDT